MRGYSSRESQGINAWHLCSLKNLWGACLWATGGFIGPKECQAAQDILEANAGRVVENADELVVAIEDFLSNPETLELCSRNARKAFLKKHCAQAVFKKWDELIEGLSKGSLIIDI